jgi:hypothetical protein
MVGMSCCKTKKKMFKQLSSLGKAPNWSMAQIQPKSLLINDFQDMNFTQNIDVGDFWIPI